MWDYTIERSIVIDASRADIWDNIVHFEKQALWSPWFVIESSAQRTINGKDGEEGTFERWEWKIIWTWERENLEIIEEDYLNQDLRFEKPFKSRSRCYFTLQKHGEDRTEVIWGMRWKLPWFMLPMKSMMKMFVSQDYDRGLRMLKVLCETWELHTYIEDSGIEEVPEVYVLGRDHTASAQDIWALMQEDFRVLEDYAKNHSINILSARAYYPKVDMKKGIFTFQTAIEILKEDYESITELPEGSTKKLYPAIKAYSLKHFWSYDFLPNTWTGVFMYLRALKLKQNKKIPPFEVYINDPTELPEKDLITDVSVPIV